MGVTEEMYRHPTVSKWLGRLAPSSHRGMMFHFNSWLSWVKVNSSKFSDFSPDDFVKYRKEGNGERFELLDLVQAYVGTLEGTQGYKKTAYSNIRSFFRHNRVELPKDSTFTIRGERPKVRGTLIADEIKQLVMSCNECYRAVYLCMFQGGMGKAELVSWSNNGLLQLKEDLKGDPEVIKVYLPGRKKYANSRPFYTLIGSDAIEALRAWMKIRPENADAIFTNQFGGDISTNSVTMYWNKHMKRLGLYKEDPTQGISIRYGKNVHEMRDVFRSLYAKSGRAPEVVEFLMGHQVDKLDYNKAHLDDSWVLKEYKRALPMFQIMSSGRPFGQVDEDEVENLREKVRGLEAQLERASVDTEKMSDLEKKIDLMMPTFEVAQYLIKREREVSELKKSDSGGG
ncbi:hypothetical protein KKH23_09040 [Patescibacteria group bacterium]|nr:hypothetical protein [Patescibacteria group bacterium]